MLERFFPGLSTTILDDIVLLALGLVLLIKGSNLFVRSAGAIARKLGVSELVIGLTLVAVGTSLPELVSAIIASIKDESELVMGNVIGANIANITLIVGGAAVLRTMQIERPMLERDGYLTFFAALLLGVFAFNQTISWIEGVVFLVIFVAYTAFLIQSSQKYEQAYHIRHFVTYFFRFGFVTGTARTLANSVRGQSTRTDNLESSNPSFDWKSPLMLVVSVLLIVLGGNFLVEEAVFFAGYLGAPVTLVGVVMALGTTAPEMSVSIAAARQNMGGMVIGNAIGSVITNTFLILGIASLIDPIMVSDLALRYAVPWFIGVTVMLLVFKKTHLEIRRTEGVSLCALYVVFIIAYGVLA